MLSVHLIEVAESLIYKEIASFFMDLRRIIIVDKLLGPTKNPAINLIFGIWNGPESDGLISMSLFEASIVVWNDASIYFIVYYVPANFIEQKEDLWRLDLLDYPSNWSRVRTIPTEIDPLLQPRSASPNWIRDRSSRVDTIEVQLLVNIRE